MAEIKISSSPELITEAAQEKAVEIEAGTAKAIPEVKTTAGLKDQSQSTVTIASEPLILDDAMVLQQKIEHVLEEDLAGLYRELKPVDQVRFKTAGEATAKKISLLLREIKIKVSEIVELIRIWLMSITGINKYFVEQEAKIKAEKILKLKQQK